MQKITCTQKKLNPLVKKKLSFLNLKRRMKVVQLDYTRVPGIKVAHRDADLPGPCVAYEMGGTGASRRFAGVTHEALRKWCEQNVQLNAVHRPPLVIAAKPAFTEDSGYFWRLCFDIDHEASDGGVDFRVDEMGLLCDMICNWLAIIWPDEDWNRARRCVWSGSFGDKPFSAHVYFWDYAVGGSKNATYVKNKPHFDVLNAVLKTRNAKCDVSITSSGLRLETMDKMTKNNRYRGECAVERFSYHNHGDDVLHHFYWTWPLVTRTEAIVLQWPPLPSTSKRPASSSSMMRVQDIVMPNDLIASIINAVPSWKDAKMHTRFLEDGVTCVSVMSTHCPFKLQPSDDMPAHQHKKPGKLYALCDAKRGEITIKCHICGDARISLRPAADDSLTAQRSEVIERFNARFAVLSDGRVLEYPHVARGVEVPLRILSKEEFRNANARHGETIAFGKKQIDYPMFWYSSNHAKRFEHVMCDPSYGTPPEVYNTFQGFNRTIEEEAKRWGETEPNNIAPCRAWLDLVFANICENDQRIFNYVLDWFAHMIQFPAKKPAVAIVMCGPPGCGKGLCAQALLNIIGQPHAKQVGAGDLTGNYNSIIIDCVFVFADESIASRDQEGANRLKLLVTETSMVRKEKYVSDRNVQVFQHLLVASNDKNAINYQHGERRFMVLDCKDRLAPPFTQMHQQVMNGVVAVLNDTKAMGCLLNYLRARDLNKFEVRDFPNTAGNWETQYASLDCYWKFIYRALCRESWCDAPYEPEEPMRLRMHVLIGILEREHGVEATIATLPEVCFAAKKDKAPYPKDMVNKALRHMFPDARLTDSGLWTALYALVDVEGTPLIRSFAQRTGNSVVQCFNLPAIRDLREAFVRVRGRCDMSIFETHKLSGI